MDTIFRVEYTTPAGVSGSVPDAPIPEWQDALGSGPGQWRALLPRPWLAAGFPGDARGSDDLVLTAAGGTVWRCYAVSDASAATSGMIWGDFTWGQSLWGEPPQDGGTLVWQGTLEEVTPTLDGKNTEHIECLLLPAAATLTDTSLAAPVTYTDTDPVLIAKSLFDQGLVPGVTWDPRNVVSGQQITQTFAIQPVRQVLDFCTTAAGTGWVNHVDEWGRFRLWQPNTLAQPDHTVIVGREVLAAAYTLTRQPLKNRIIVTYKGGNSVIATAAGWTQAGTRDAVYNFPEITDAETAQLVASALLGNLNQITLRARLSLVQRPGGLYLTAITLHPAYGGTVQIPATGVVASAAGQGWGLFAIRPGDTLQLWLDGGDPYRWTWGDAVWGQSRWTGGQVGILQTPQIVQTVTYHGADSLDLDLASPRPHLNAAHVKTQQYVERALANLAGA